MELSRLLIAGFISFTLYALGVVLYRLFFHPLAKLPGPKFAAITQWYETYYDVFKSPGGQYYLKLEQEHKRCGPILRINPNEVQIDDPEFFDKIYSSAGVKRHRHELQQRGNASPGAMASAGPHDLHRLRRSAIQNFFSKAAILRLESRIQSRVQLLLQRLEYLRRQGATMQAGTLFGALTLDIITEYSFGESWGCLEAEDMNEPVLDIMREGFATIQLRKHFPIFSMLPKFILMKIPAAATVFAWQTKISSSITRVKEARDVGNKEIAGKQTIFSEILDSKLPPHEKATPRIADEALILVIAGTESTTRVLSHFIFYMLSNSVALARLRDELDAAMHDPNAEYTLTKLEALPYLTACIKETLRATANTMNRSLFYADEPLQYKQYTLPPGTQFCMNFHSYLHKPDIFPEPEVFDPERWMGDSDAVKLRNKHFYPFSKGSRNCIGQK